MEPKLKQIPYFRCEKGSDSVPVCQKCEACVLAWKIFSTKEWFQRVNDISQRRFLASILQQLNSLYLLRYFQNILQTTQGKDFTYNRSRINLSRQEGMKGKVMKSSLNRMLDKAAEQKMRELLFWFGNSTHRTKANYTLLLLQMCNPKLLLTAANVIRVLFLREWNNISELHQDCADVLFFPEKDDKSEVSHVYWAAKPRPVPFPLSKASANKSMFENVAGKTTTSERYQNNSLYYISKMNKLFSTQSGIHEPGHDHFNLLMNADDVRALSSGFSQHRDFIRHLPIHLSKYILRMLDRNSLNRCASVSQHWAALAQQVKMDLSMHNFIQNQISLLQGSYTRGIDPTYANKLSIPVPKMIDEKKRMCMKNPKWKLRTKTDYSLWTAYQNQETQMIPMEERNVFCGTYNVRIVSDTWDRNRVIHYTGGDLVALSSKRNVCLLDIAHVKLLPIEFRGHAGTVRTLFLCEEENVLLSGSYDLSIRCWDLKTGACIRIFYGHQGTITCMDLYKKRLVSGAKDGQVKEWELHTGKCLKTFKHKDPILATRINDTYIVSSCERGLVKVWHIAMAQLVKTLTGHEGAVKCLFFDQWHLLSGGADGLVIAWSMVGKYERCLMAFKHPKEVLHVALLYLRVISACADGKIRIYSFLNGNCLKVIKVDARGDPVLSFFYQVDRMVVNTESNILMFNFEHVKWQYAHEKSKQKKNKDREEEKEESSLGDIPSKSSTQVYSLKESETQESQVPKFPKARIPVKPPKTPSAMLLEIPEQQGRPKSPRKNGKKGADSVPREANDMGDGQENLEAKLKAEDDVETPVKLFSLSKKKFWKTFISPDRFLLTVSALQQAHNSGEFAYPHRPQTQVIDAWGPSISYPRKVLNFKGKTMQHEVDRLRCSNPPIDVKQTKTPLEIQKLQPNLKNSLHSPRVQSTIPQPMVIRSKFPGSLKGEEQLTSSIDGAVRSMGPLTSMQVIKPSRILTPQVCIDTLALKRERPRFYTTLDPFRMHNEFMLLTVKEEKQYEEAKMKEYQASESTRTVDEGKDSKTAWIRKIRGLPIDNFMKRGKIAAPELGQNVFI